MFDVGFSELIVIAIVALVVIGPERLPKVARTAGHMLGRLQRYVNDVKADIDREMQLDELKKLQAEVQESARSFERSISSEVNSLQASLEQSAQAVQDAAAGKAGETPGQVTVPESSVPPSEGGETPAGLAPAGGATHPAVAVSALGASAPEKDKGQA